MFDHLIQKDRELLIYLNNLGSEQWDFLWLGITNQFYWAPLFAFLIYLIFKALGWRKGVFVLFTMVILITFSDQFANFIKNHFMRFRPNNNIAIQDQLRTLINPQSSSFYSGHATTSSLVTVFIILLLKNKYKYIWFLILFPLIFGYSRLYLGVHFPLDILGGYVVGLVFGTLFYLIYSAADKKLFT